MKAISIVFPHGTNKALGKKTLEVRSWLPPLNFSEDLLIPAGKVVAIVKIKLTREYVESDIPAAMASRWEPGYYSWELTDIRVPLRIPRQLWPLVAFMTSTL